MTAAEFMAMHQKRGTCEKCGWYACERCSIPKRYAELRKAEQVVNVLGMTNVEHDVQQSAPNS